MTTRSMQFFPHVLITISKVRDGYLTRARWFDDSKAFNGTKGRPAGEQPSELKREAKYFADYLKHGYFTEPGLKAETVTIMDDTGQRSVRKMYLRKSHRR